MFANSANPLRQRKPPRGQCLFAGTFYFGNEDARLEGQFGQSVALGWDYLWVNDELSIPLAAIQSISIIEKGRLPRRRALKIVFVNPISLRPEVVLLLSLDFFGFYRLKPLEKLKHQLELTRTGAVRPPTNAVGPGAAPGREHPDACEVCGAKPAFYVCYTYQVCALVLSYNPPFKRRVHCRRHNLLYGLAHYLVTAAVGWCGTGILAFPFIAFATGLSLEPSLGKRASRALGILPTALLVGLVAWWAVGRT